MVVANHELSYASTLTTSKTRDSSNGTDTDYGAWDMQLPTTDPSCYIGHIGREDDILSGVNS